ncbi:MAG: S41 family peptidase [Myxococcota bacterium]|nr:S41 family peptidase [Myxococcota bacterium]
MMGIFPLSFVSLMLNGCNFDGSKSNDETKAAANDPMFGVGGRGNRANHSLPSLLILNSNIQIIKGNYVDSHRFDAELIEQMFEGIISRLERNIDQARFIHNNQRVHVTIGAKSQTFPLPAFDVLDDLMTAMLPIAEFMDQELTDDINRATVEYNMINGALSALDPHTTLLPPIEAAEMDLDNSGEFGGLGIEITIREGQLTVKQPIEDTPASKAGLIADDRIVQIEEHSTINMDLTEAVSLLRGPVGAPVQIMVMRKGWKKPQPFTIIRGRIKIDPVKGELLDGNIAYIRIQSFNATVSDDMNAYLDEFQSKRRLNGIILDLRYNPGGYLRQAKLVADKFIAKGVLVSTIEGPKRIKEDYKANKSESLTDVPMTVLINASSASASEIVAGALRNLNRAIIIGERSFGKGSVQHLYQNSDDSKLKLTVAQYLTPGDRSIQSVGISPDIVLNRSIIEKDEGEEVISLYWDEWRERESDLEHHLSYDRVLDDKIAYQVRYLQPQNDNTNKIDPKTDWEVQFARRVLESAPNSDRAIALSSLRSFILDEQLRESESIRKAFRDLDRNWTGKNNPEKEAISLDVELDLGEDKKLVAGVEEEITLKVKNNGDAPLHQLSVWTESKNPYLDKREFYIGYLNAGSEIELKKDIRVPYGYGSEKGNVDFIFRDQKERELRRIQETYQTQSNLRPVFRYSLKMFDDGSGESKGNGDGILQPGETIEFEVEVTNTGDGMAVRPFVSLKNKARKYLDLKVGNLVLGDWKTLDGKDCNKDDIDCFNTIAPQATYKGRFRFQIKENAKGLTKKPSVELRIGDNYAYDYDSVVRGGFGSYFQIEEKIELPIGDTLADVQRSQPTIHISKTPNLESDSDAITFSGSVKDDVGVKEIIIFQGEDKVFYRGESQAITEVPFTVDSSLVEGENQFFILAKDREGLSTSHAINVYKK